MHLTRVENSDTKRCHFFGTPGIISTYNYNVKLDFLHTGYQQQLNIAQSKGILHEKGQINIYYYDC